jgi:hypothetical protein
LTAGCARCRSLLPAAFCAEYIRIYILDIRRTKVLSTADRPTQWPERGQYVNALQIQERHPMGADIFKATSGSSGAESVLLFPRTKRAVELGCPMKRLEVLDLFELAETLSNANRTLTLEKGKAIDFYFTLNAVRQALIKFQKEQAAFSLSRDSATQVISGITTAMRANFFADETEAKFKDDMNFESEVSGWVFYHVKNTLNEFRHVFSAECRKSETYFIEQKGGI